MATDVEALLVRLEADITKYEKAMQRAVGTTERRSREMRKALSEVEANAESSLSRAGAKFGDAISSGVRGGIAGLAATMSIGTIVKYSDEWTNLTNRLKASGVEASALASTQERLVGIAQRSRSSISDVTELYAKLSVTGKELGASQNDVATATETITKSLKLSGASTGEIQSAILQLGQALQSGSLQGDELRSLLENAPGLARIIAKEFGVAVGQLKELGSQGQLEAGRVFKAIVAGAPEINRTFAETTATFGDYITSLQNALLGYVGALQQLLQSSPELRRALQEQRDRVQELADSYGITQREAEKAAAAQEKANGAKLGNNLKTLKAQIEEAEVSLQGFIATAGNFASLPLRGEEKAEALRLIRQAASGTAEDAARATAELMRLGETSPTFSAAIASVNSMIERLGQLRRAAESANGALQQGPNAPETPAPPKMFSGAAKAGEAQAMADADAQAKSLINDQLIRARLDDNARKVQDKVDELRKKLNAQGFSSDPETLRKNAEAIITAESAGKGGGGGKSDEIAKFAEALQKTLDPTIEFNKQIDQLFAAIDRGLIPAEKAAEAFTLIGERTLEAGNKAASSKSELEGMFKGVESAIQSVGSKFGDALGELATGGKVDFKQLADSIIKDLIRIATQILIMQPLIESLKGAFKGGDAGGVGGGLSSIVSGLFGGLSGARANGGPVSSRSAYLVGERGPEIFVPSRPGTIIPNGAAGGGGSVVNVTVQNNAGAEIGVKQSRGPNGVDIQLVVEQAVLKSLNGGAIGRQLTSYGFNRMNAR